LKKVLTNKILHDKMNHYGGHMGKQKTDGVSLQNRIKAKQIAVHEKTIAVLMDLRLGFDTESAEEIISLLAENGYFVHGITVEEFCTKNLASLGFLLLIPHAVSVPAKCADPLLNYIKQGGQLITLGGPLFADLIEEDGEGYKKIFLDDQILDATFSGRMSRIVIEGLCPTYKVFFNDDVQDVQTEEDQCQTGANLRLSRPERVICPCARPHGAGYDMERRNRFIPLLHVMGEGGRAGGKRGAAAFFMLADTRGRLTVTNGNRPGSVSVTTIGSAIASIGFLRQDILNIEGTADLLLSMVKTMERGLYLFEGGSEHFVYDEQAGSLRMGAKIVNLSQDFQEVTVRFSLSGGNEGVYEKGILASPRNMTHVEINPPLPPFGSYRIKTELLYQGEIIDRIVQDLEVVRLVPAPPEEFVTVKDGEFWLKGKPWPAFGINYWPHYYPGFESEDYWLGWLDKSNYDPQEVEWDLIQMEEMGYTCLFTRVDGNAFERSLPQLRDFMLRCERHGMKLSLSLCNITCPVNYQPLAFRRLMEETWLSKSPVLFTHDIAWEIGPQFFSPSYVPQWNERWTAWLLERYGSLEWAEKDFGMPLPQTEDGSVTAPPLREFTEDGPWRVRSAAYRRFVDDMVSRMWNDAVSDMRKVDPVHLIGYRMGSISYTTAALTATNKHIDYASPEGYAVSFDEDGYYSSCCITRLFDMLTGGKPVIWSEFGVSLTDVSWRSLIWDNKNWRPYSHKIREQTEYMHQFYRMFKATDVQGCAPWWYCGGFRRVEMSDFGFIGPDGMPRPAALEYAGLGKWFHEPRQKKSPNRIVTVDPDEKAGGWGSIFFGKDILLACREADKKGETIAFRTPGTGTTSADTPMLAVGNVPYNGYNPPKYLNAEFNSFEIKANGFFRSVGRGDKVPVPAGEKLYVNVSIGNLREAAWLTPKHTPLGGVYLVSTEKSALKVRIPIPADVPYLSDAVIGEAFFCDAPAVPMEIQLYMEAEGRMKFGEIFHFTLLPCKGTRT
jgi:hypothetical protein